MKKFVIILPLILLVFGLYKLNFIYYVEPAEIYALSLPPIQIIMGCQNDIFDHNTGELIYRPKENGNCLTVPNPWLPQNIITNTAWEQVRVEQFGYKIIQLLLILMWFIAAWPIWIWAVLAYYWVQEKTIDKSPTP
jgi:hypothetical protein